MEAMRRYKIHTKYGAFDFIGSRQKETVNWHYYDTEDGSTLKFRKEHVVMIGESKRIEYGNREK